MKKTLLVLALFAMVLLPSFCAEIRFSGGHTKVSLKEGDRSVSLSGGALVETQDIRLEAQSIELYGPDYCYASCTGEVKALQSAEGISLTSPSLFYDRSKGLVQSDSWIEIQDTKNEASLSGAWFEYDMKAGLIKLKMMAKIIKVTDKGLMVCRADSIEFDSKAKTVTMKGSAKVDWNGDNYSAAMIVVDLESNGISMYGDISGEVNG